RVPNSRCRRASHPRSQIGRIPALSTTGTRSLTPGATRIQAEASNVHLAVRCGGQAPAKEYARLELPAKTMAPRGPTRRMVPIFRGTEPPALAQHQFASTVSADRVISQGHR